MSCGSIIDGGVALKEKLGGFLMSLDKRTLATRVQMKIITFLA